MVDIDFHEDDDVDENPYKVEAYGETEATAGTMGRVRIKDPKSGQIARTFYWHCPTSKDSAEHFPPPSFDGSAIIEPVDYQTDFASHALMRDVYSNFAFLR